MAISATRRKMNDGVEADVKEDAAKPEKFVLVGYKTLSAPIVRLEDPIRYGDVVEVSGKALEWLKKSTYLDDDNYECDTFVPADSEEGKRAIAIASGEMPPPRVRRRAVSRRKTNRG